MGARQNHIDAGERERAGVTAVRDRLVQQFPELEPTTVDEIVEDAHRSLTGRVRDFIPVFVERRSRDRLRKMVGRSFA